MSHTVVIHGEVRHRHGWRPQLPGPPRHAPLSVSSSNVAPIDMREHAPPALDQGAAGTCGAHARRYLEDVDRSLLGLSAHPSSRAMSYWLARLKDGSSTLEDSGCTVEGVLSAACQWGSCDESLYPYTDDVALLSVPPQPSQYVAAAPYELTGVASCVDVAHVRAAIASGRPVVGGVTLFESVLDDKTRDTGAVEVPPSSAEVLGGHMQCFLYDDLLAGELWALNSWGTNTGATFRGARGWFRYSYEYLARFGDDFHTAGVKP